MNKFLFTVIFLIFNSCTHGGNKPTFSVKNETFSQDSLIYSYKFVKESSPYVVENNGVLDTSYYKISYPFFENSSINEIINPYILVDGDESFTSAAESFILGFNEFVEDENTNKIHSSWYKSVITKVWTNTALLLTLATSVEEYTGGAHGNYYKVISNIDLNTKQKIEIKDIFEEDKLVQFTKIAETIFRKSEGLHESTSLAKDFFFENGIFAITNNFGLKKDSLILYYNEYEIKPYAAGPTCLKIPFSEIESLLNSTGKKYLLSIKQSNHTL